MRIDCEVLSVISEHHQVLPNTLLLLTTAQADKREVEPVPEVGGWDKRLPEEKV